MSHFVSLEGVTHAYGGKGLPAVEGMSIHVNEGDRVEKGAVVAILESMKMEMRIVAECAGTVASVTCQAGQTVERSAVVASITPD